MPFFTQCTDSCRAAPRKVIGLRNILNSETVITVMGASSSRPEHEPILIPGIVVLVDVSVRRMQESDWYERILPAMYSLNYMNVTAAVVFISKARGW